MAPFTGFFLAIRSTSQSNACSTDVKINNFDSAGAAVRVYSLAVDLIVDLTALVCVFVAEMSRRYSFFISAISQGGKVWASEETTLFEQTSGVRQKDPRMLSGHRSSRTLL